MKTSEQINEIAAALAKAQGLLKPAEKDAINPAYRGGYKYADLAAVWAAWREVGPACGLAVMQDVLTGDFGVSVTTVLMHTSGQWTESGPIIIPLEKPGAHGIGSGISYGKRYGLGAALGIVAEDDDDGNAAVEGVQRFAGAPRRDFSKGPVHGPAAQTAGDPKPPATAEQQAASEKEARLLFPTAADQAERAKYIAELKRLKAALKLTDAESLALSVTYLGKGVPVTTADLPDLSALVDFLRNRNGEGKFSVSA